MISSIVKILRIIRLYYTLSRRRRKEETAASFVFSVGRAVYYSLHYLQVTGISICLHERQTKTESSGTPIGKRRSPGRPDMSPQNAAERRYAFFPGLWHSLPTNKQQDGVESKPPRNRSTITRLIPREGYGMGQRQKLPKTRKTKRPGAPVFRRLPGLFPALD